MNYFSQDFLHNLLETFDEIRFALATKEMAEVSPLMWLPADRLTANLSTLPSNVAVMKSLLLTMEVAKSIKMPVHAMRI